MASFFLMNDMKKASNNQRSMLLLLLLLTINLLGSAQTEQFDPKEHAQFQTDRPDGRFVSTRAVVHQLMKTRQPIFSFSNSLTPEEFLAWRQNLQRAAAELMQHPQLQNLPEPKHLWTEQREGYRVEKWEAYPLPQSVVPYLVLIPDAATEESPTPAVLCIPGWGGTKEELAGEPQLYQPDQATRENRNAMAYQYVKAGLIAVAIDNPGSGELADLEQKAGTYNYDFQNVARPLLELGWSYLGYSSYTSLHILNWMKRTPIMDKNKLIVSGFSFGTEPLMMLGALDESIYAFVYNDFLCRTRERDLVLTMPNAKGLRGWPNDISHLIPNFLNYFDFPDLVAALAPRPLICTEGGLDRDLTLVARAYELAGSPQNYVYYHYKALQDPSLRKDLQQLPEGLDLQTYFQLVNVQPENHYFKAEYVIPWIKKLLEK